MSNELVRKSTPIEGELLLRRERRTDDGRLGIGDYVSRDGNDVHQVIDINESGDLIEVVCIVEPPIYLGSDEPWTRLGEVESNIPRRYEKVDYTPPQSETNRRTSGENS